MIQLVIVTPAGIYFEGQVEYIVADGGDGQIGILKDHIPIVIPIKNGFVKAVTEEHIFYAISGGILEQSHNIITVIAQEVAKGSTLKFAQSALERQRSVQKEENRRLLQNFAELEKELALNLKEIKASQL